MGIVLQRWRHSDSRKWKLSNWHRQNSQNSPALKIGTAIGSSAECFTQMALDTWWPKAAHTSLSTKSHSSNTIRVSKWKNSRSGFLALISTNRRAVFNVKTVTARYYAKSKFCSQTSHSLKSKSTFQTMWFCFRVNIKIWKEAAAGSWQSSFPVGYFLRWIGQASV